MRQGDGSDLLGQGNPRNADIGIIYVGADDSRQEILAAISDEELRGRKQIAIVLSEQSKVFRQPVEFDGLKSMRQGMNAKLIFISPSGPGPAEFARHRRFTVYSSLDSFKTALLNESGPTNPRSRPASGGEKRDRGGLRWGSKRQGQNVSPPSPAGPSRAQSGPPMMPPTPPTPRIMPQASAQPTMPPTPPTPRMSPGGRVPSPPPVPSIADEDTREIEDEKTQVPGPSSGGSGGAAVPPAALGLGAVAVNALEDDDEELAPTVPPASPVTPRQSQGGGIVVSAQGSATPGVSSTRTPQDAARRRPTPRALPLGPQANTPRPASGSLPAVSARGSSSRGDSDQLATPQGRSGGRGGANAGGGTTIKLPPAVPPEASAPAKQGKGKSGNTDKSAAVAPVAAGALVGGTALAAASAASAPASTAATGSPGSPGGPGQRQVGLTPLPPPHSRRRRRTRWKRILLVLLILCTLLVIGGIVVAAPGGFAGLTTLGRLTATVTITPKHQDVQNTFLITGQLSGANAAQRQIPARKLTAQSTTLQKTGNATGSIPATRAQGVLRFINTNTSATTLASTVITGNDGVQVTFNGPITVPANPPFIDVNAYAVNPGAAGNIKALDISQPCCFAGITVRNQASFSGGQDAKPNSVIQQSDIDNAAKPLISQLSASTQAVLQKQVKSNERVVDGSFKCVPTTKANQKVGAVVSSVTVSVSVACSEEVFDLAAALQMASNLLPTNLPSGTDLTGYKLQGHVVTNLVNASVVSAQGQVNVQVQATGRWVYQFSSQKQQQIKQALLKQSKAEAQSILAQYTGVGEVNINISGGSTMPANASDITLNFTSVPDLSQSAPVATATSYVPVNGTPASGGAGTPINNGTPLGGS